MRNLIKISLLVFIALFFLNTNVPNSSAQTVFEVLDKIRDLNPDAVKNPEGAVLFTENCSIYPGFLNRIVECVTHIVSQGSVYSKLAMVNRQFSMLTNVALVLYIMFFGLKLSMNVVENVKGEIMVVLITCFLITYVNNTIRMQNFIRFFVGFQSEFMGVATAAMYPDKNSSAKYKNLLCFNDKIDSASSNVNIWSRMDCIITYIVGSHPLIEKKGSAFQQNASELAAGIEGIIGGSAGTLGELDNKYIYPFKNITDTNGKPASFSDMAVDPYNYDQKACIEKMQAGNFSETDLLEYFKTCSCFQALLKGSVSTLSLDQIITEMNKNCLAFVLKPRPVDNGKIKSTMTYSLITIIVGMLFQDPTIGLGVFLTGFFILLMIIAAFGQAMIVYLTSLFAIFVLGLFAPLILPTVLFTQTRRIFETWIQLLFAYSLQPGIVLCYLSFMVYVLQYVISYENCLSPLDTKTQGNCLSLADFHFGETYTKSDRTPGEGFQILTKTEEGKKPQGYLDLQIGDSKSENSTASNAQESYINRGQNALDDVANEVATEETNEIIRKSSLFGNSGGEQSVMNVPGFSFFNGTIAGKKSLSSALSGLFFNTNPVNANLEKVAIADNINLPALRELTYGNECAPLGLTITVRDAVICMYKKQQAQEYAIKTAYMQTLLIILVTLCITMTFLNNVMDFSGKLVGAGVTPVGKALNVYNLATSKLSRMLKGPVG